MSASLVALMDEIECEIRAERRSTAKIVRCLAVIDSQRLYLQLGFSSLYDLVTRRLGYSSSAAMRRIKAARVAIAEPTVIAKLESGELNFATIDVLSDFVNEPPLLKDLAEEFCGRSREDAEKIVASLRPVAKSAVRDRVIPVVVAATSIESPLFDTTEQNSKYFRANAQSELRKCEEFGERPDERFYLSFAASKEVKEMLDRARQLMFNGEPVTFEKVVGTAVNFYLSRHCPKERQKRREERAAKIAAQKAKAVTRSGEKSTTGGTSARQVRVTVRDRVLERDGFQCSFVSEAGERCGCRADLEIDHIIPIGRGGSSAESNLRTLCRAHNLASACDVYGADYIEHRISKRQRA